MSKWGIIFIVIIIMNNIEITDKSVIHELKCGDCDAVHVGPTGQNFGVL